MIRKKGDSSAKKVASRFDGDASFVKAGNDPPLRVSVCRLSFSQTEASFQDLLRVISAERKAHILSFKHEKDRLRSLFAELLLRHELAQCPLRSKNKELYDGAEAVFKPICVSETDLVENALASPLPPLLFSYGLHRKPLLSVSKNNDFFYSSSEYHSPTCIHFNLSHSGDFVACAVSSHECGVDIQEIRPVRDSLITKNLSEEEQTDLLYFEGAARELRFFEYWVLKEAYIKAIGQGISYPLKKAVFNIREDGLVTMPVPAQAAFCAALFQVAPGYMGATGIILN